MRCMGDQTGERIKSIDNREQEIFCGKFFAEHVAAMAA